MHKSKRALLIGLVGSLLLAASAWLSSPWGLGFAGRSNTLAVRWAQTTPAVAGATLLFLAWLGVRDQRPALLWRNFVIWCAPLLACPPLLSKDAWAYLEQGWIVLRGFDPYLTGLGTIGGPFATRVDEYWFATTTVYPPLALLIQAAMVAISGASPFWSLLMMRLPGLLAVAGLGAMAPQIARRCGQNERLAVWFVLLNPLVLVHFVGGAHNDAWAVALGVAGIWLACRWPGWWPAGGVLVGLAMAVKQPLGLMMVAVALIGVAADPNTTGWAAWRPTFARALWRLPVGLLATMAGFAIPTVIGGWGLGWATGSGSPYSVGNPSLTHTVAASIEALSSWSITQAMAVVAPVILGIGVLGLCWLAWRQAASRPIAFVGWGLIVFALSYYSLQPWYLLWGGVLLGMIVLDAKVLSWVIAAVGCLLGASVFLDYAGFPITVVQLMMVAGAWPLAKWVDGARLATSAAE